MATIVGTKIQTTGKIPRPGSISFEDRVTKSVPYEWGYGSTPRTAKLRDSLYWKAAVTKEWTNVAMGLGKCTFREGQGIKIDMDRARLVTKAYKETEGQPWTIRRAKAVEKLCEEMPILIKPGELIVGDANGAPDEIRWYPETSVWFMPDAVTTGGYSSMVTEEERKEIIEDICAYWKDRCSRDRIAASIPEAIWPIISEPVANSVAFTIWEESRTLPNYDYESLFKEGLKARIERAEAKLKELDSKVGEMDPAEYLKKKHEWQAMAICGRAIIRYAQRHAELAREQARAEKDQTRKKELKEMAAILDWVPANPPRTFHECLQFYWIIEIVAHYLTLFGNGCGIRIDQVWWPCYEADMKADRITREKALELVECLFIKIQDLGSPLEWPAVFSATSGFDVVYTANICGSDGHGKDVSNDLSCIIMEALANLHVNQPPIALRYHRNISPDVVERAIDLDRAGMGHPSWFNEDLLEKWGLMRGWAPEDAKNAQVGACVTCNIPGKAITSTGMSEVGALFPVKLLEEILGLFEPPPAPGRPELKDPRQMDSADELLDAFCERLLFYTRIGVNSWNLGHQVLMEYNPDPCNSFLLDEALERGIDLTELHKENDTWPNMVCFGGVNFVDSLAAIQKLVFDDKKYTMDELLTALKANWEGYEEMHQAFLNAPKYGNDDDYADEWAVKALTKIHDTVRQVKDAWGYPLTFDGSTASAYAVAGLTCGASPDGRRASSPLDDGTLSPMTGADKNGPTAVLNSVGKLPYMHTQLFNQRFMPQFLEGENKKLFAQYLREWYEKGTIPHIQFNVVDNKVLRDAQEHPEKYPNLQVRVAGYSAFWIDLAKETQDSIIARTEQPLGC
jgi:pyruvate formate-lyase/glycerol dehydratase family glycyl radical enzyme